MLDELAKLDHDQLLFLLLGVATAGIVVLATVTILAEEWRRSRKIELELAFKEDLLERGFSIEEIERLLRARAPGWITALSELMARMGTFFQRLYRSLTRSWRLATARRQRQTTEQQIQRLSPRAEHPRHPKMT